MALCGPGMRRSIPRVPFHEILISDFVIGSRMAAIIVIGNSLTKSQSEICDGLGCTRELRSWCWDRTWLGRVVKG